MEVAIRKFQFEDVPLKVKWVNDSENNKYLHYDLPLNKKKTEEWFLNNKDNYNRFDAVITFDGIPVGIIGLLNIDYQKLDAEYYITVGEKNLKGKSIATKASILLLKYAFNEINLKKIYLTTETENIPMQKLARKLSMIKEAQISDYSYREGYTRDVYYYSVSSKDFTNGIIYPDAYLSDIEFLTKDQKLNEIYIKRDDLIPFSFGGNKARKATYFFKEILDGNYNVVVTYGSKVSNHCRVVSHLCFKYGLKCIIVSPFSEEKDNYNRDLIRLSGAEIVECSIKEVSTTIESLIKKESEKNGQRVYFIPGGGHGNLGTQAYVDAYNEIKIWSNRKKINFDYIFLASGTGTTQAGLIAGKILHQDKYLRIIGISVARDHDRGIQVIQESIDDYFYKIGINNLDYISSIEFYDNYVEKSYGKTNSSIDKNIENMYLNYGIPLNSTYTGKAFTGMVNFINENDISKKKILFVHTGGNPLFFDDLNRTFSK